jgi:hypothetical protein
LQRRTHKFAQQVIRLHRDRELWTALLRNGLRNIDEHFSRAAARHSLEELLGALKVLHGVGRPEQNDLMTGGALNRSTAIDWGG